VLPYLKAVAEGDVADIVVWDGSVPTASSAVVPDGLAVVASPSLDALADQMEQAEAFARAAKVGLYVVVHPETADVSPLEEAMFAERS
jgi:imidazolonepropionase-like amidohydrolase